MQNLKIKVTEIIQRIKDKVMPKLLTFDSKFQTFMPNPKLRKISYIAVASLFGFMFLIILLGLLLSPLRRTATPVGTTLNKPNIIVASPAPEAEISVIQRKLLNLETDIKNLVFPESILNTPTIESNLEI